MTSNHSIQEIRYCIPLQSPLVPHLLPLLLSRFRSRTIIRTQEVSGSGFRIQVSKMRFNALAQFNVVVLNRENQPLLPICTKFTRIAQDLAPKFECRCIVANTSVCRGNPKSAHSPVPPAPSHPSTRLHVRHHFILGACPPPTPLPAEAREPAKETETRAGGDDAPNDNHSSESHLKGNIVSHLDNAPLPRNLRRHPGKNQRKMQWKVQGRGSSKREKMLIREGLCVYHHHHFFRLLPLPLGRGTVRKLAALLHTVRVHVVPPVEGRRPRRPHVAKVCTAHLAVDAGVLRMLQPRSLFQILRLRSRASACAVRSIMIESL